MKFRPLQDKILVLPEARIKSDVIQVMDNEADSRGTVVAVGDIVSEWIIKGAVITSANFGDYSWDDDGTIVGLTVEVQPDYCILNY